MLQVLRQKKISNYPYRPHSNVTHKRSHGYLVQYLKITTEKDPQSLDTYLRPARFCRSTVHHKTIGMSPMQYLFGFYPKVRSNLNQNHPLFTILITIFFLFTL